MSDRTDELKKRTKQFALRSLDLIEQLPNTTRGRVLANQLARSATSVGANYRAACRARSRAEFAAKLGTVAEEADRSGRTHCHLHFGAAFCLWATSDINHQTSNLTLMNLGFVGVGRMGANMARRARDCGYHVTAVYDSNRKAATDLAGELGAAACQDLSDVTAQSEVIVTVVSDDAAMR